MDIEITIDFPSWTRYNGYSEGEKDMRLLEYYRQNVPADAPRWRDLNEFMREAWRTKFLARKWNLLL